MLRSQTCSIGALHLGNTDCSTPTQSRSKFMDDVLAPINLGPSLESSRLAYLYLNSNNFSGDRVFVLAECIRVCTSLETLVCSDCSLTSSDITTLTTHLKSFGSSHGNLEEWNLDNNPIDDDGVTALTGSINELFPFLIRLTLYGNPVSDEAKERLYILCLQVDEEEDNSDEDWDSEEEWGSDKEGEEEDNEEEDIRRVLRSTALAEWKTTQSPPQREELMSVFLRMWDELCWILSYLVYTRSHYPHLYGPPSEVMSPEKLLLSDASSVIQENITEQQDESLGHYCDSPHGMDQQKSCGAQSLLGVRPRDDDVTVIASTKKPRTSQLLSISEDEPSTEQIDESIGH